MSQVNSMVSAVRLAALSVSVFLLMATMGSPTFDTTTPAATCLDR